MAQRGFDCVLLTRRPAPVPGASEVIALRPGDAEAGWFLALGDVRRHARRVAAQWVHGHYVTGYGLWAAACGLGPGVPLVLTAWGSDLLVTPREPGWRGAAMSALVNWSLARAALVTADSQQLLAEARARVPASSVTRFEEVTWGAEVERFAPGKPAPGFEIASLRRWSPLYRIDAILRAFAAFRAARPQAAARLHLLGGGPDEAALRALASRLGLGIGTGEAVAFTGAVDDATMVRTLQRCRVSISVPVSDGTSVAMLESMACGLPVIASDLPANRQWVDASSGLLVGRTEAALVDELTAALLRLHDDPAFAAREGARHRGEVLKRASRRQQMDRMATFYAALRLHAPKPAAA
jgi:glycosyltransferase involved in cell wall biosynthesis